MKPTFQVSWDYCLSVVVYESLGGYACEEQFRRRGTYLRTKITDVSKANDSPESSIISWRTHSEDRVFQEYHLDVNVIRINPSFVEQFSDKFSPAKDLKSICYI